MIKTRALGKGLNALLPGNIEEDGEGREYFICQIDDIRPNPYQPRKEMKGSDLDQLAASIQEKGVLQPLIVTERELGVYELIAGERRWRAAKLAGLTEVPVLVKDVTDIERLELAIIENIQRENLNPLDEALAYDRLMKEFGLTQEKVAKKVGKERSTVANLIRILQLPDYAKKDVADGVMSLGHARVLLGISDPEVVRELRDKIVNQGLNVRQAEELAKKQKSAKPISKPRKTTTDGIPESYCKALSHDLVRYLSTKCRIVQQGDRGRLEIEYYSVDDLERLLELIVKK
ncbi:MAG: ParB/RepB/Spo0J family partition protein [Proteobacteria bacterium]|nr:ParB/RepB/Spo0J family partition protein [Pseudomonadota bacterium]MBU1708574.1 ParB/RepB/Spo0J family partition protein [Pseudomonadota bacterium]